jgi:hypothetical protein
VLGRRGDAAGGACGQRKQGELVHRSSPGYGLPTARQTFTTMRASAIAI